MNEWPLLTEDMEVNEMARAVVESVATVAKRVEAMEKKMGDMFKNIMKNNLLENSRDAREAAVTVAGGVVNKLNNQNMQHALEQANGLLTRVREAAAAAAKKRYVAEDWKLDVDNAEIIEQQRNLNLSAKAARKMAEEAAKREEIKAIYQEVTEEQNQWYKVEKGVLKMVDKLNNEVNMGRENADMNGGGRRPKRSSKQRKSRKGRKSTKRGKRNKRGKRTKKR